MAIEYCNLTKDLQDAFSQIEQYRGLREIRDWVEDAEQGSYRSNDAGYTEMVLIDGLEAAEAEAYPVESSGSNQFFYQSNLNSLVVRLALDEHPENHTIEAGPEWLEMKTRARNDAQEMLEGFLSALGFAVPFQKIFGPGQSYNSRNYDFAIRRACALLTCANIVRAVDPGDRNVDLLYKQVDNPNPAPGELPGIVQRIEAGDIKLRTQITEREAGGFNVYESPSLSSTAYFEIRGRYTGGVKQYWRLEIDTLGVPGVATWKISYDNGATFESEGQPTLDTSTNSRRVDIGYGLTCEFYGTFTDGDYVTIEVFPSGDVPDNQAAGNIVLRRV